MLRHWLQMVFYTWVNWMANQRSSLLLSTCMLLLLANLSWHSLDKDANMIQRTRGKALFEVHFSYWYVTYLLAIYCSDIWHCSRHIDMYSHCQALSIRSQRQQGLEMPTFMAWPVSRCHLLPTLPLRYVINWPPLLSNECLSRFTLH